MKYHLLIDCSFINEKTKGEIDSLEYYAGRLFQGFRQSNIFEAYAIVWAGYESYLDELAGYEVPKIVIDGHHYATPWPVVDRILGLVSPKIMREVNERKVDIVLSPYSFECRLFFPKRYRQHVMVHDLVLIDYARKLFGPLKLFLWHRYQCALLKRAPYLISISKTTSKAVYSFAGRKSYVVYNSFPFDFSVGEKPVVSVVGKKYILDINRFIAEKNPQVLIRAFSLIKDKVPHYLYFKGTKKTPNYYDVKELVNELNLQDRVILDTERRVESELKYLYSHADLFVSPSLAEGFGWTPIEAAILKAPVLVSDIDVLKEVTQGKIPTFNPYSHEHLAEKMLGLLQNPPSAKERDELALFYSNCYSLNRQIDRLTDCLLKSL